MIKGYKEIKSFKTGKPPVSFKRKRPKRICNECFDSSTKAFTCPILKNEVWFSIAGAKDLLCFECAEKRLGREITFDDTDDIAGNYGFYVMYKRLLK